MIFRNLHETLISDSKSKRKSAASRNRSTLSENGGDSTSILNNVEGSSSKRGRPPKLRVASISCGATSTGSRRNNGNSGEFDTSNATDSVDMSAYMEKLAAESPPPSESCNENSSYEEHYSSTSEDEEEEDSTKGDAKAEVRFYYF